MGQDSQPQRADVATVVAMSCSFARIGASEVRMWLCRWNAMRALVARCAARWPSFP